MHPSALAILAVAIPTLYFVQRSILDKFRKPKIPYFPGPKPLPIIGNLLDLPESKVWLKAKEWAVVHGPRVFIRPLPGLAEPLLFLNSYADVIELMEKRSAIYSSRPTSVMMCELQSWDWLVSNMPSGPTHRAHRAYLHRFLQPSEVGRFSVIQWAIIMKTLGKMLDFAKEDSQEGSSTKKSRGGKRFALLLRWMTAAMVLRVAYGYDVDDIDDHYVRLAERGIEMLGEAAVPGKWFVDIFPWLKYIPEWLPGVSFQKVARSGRTLALQMKYEPYAMAKKEVLSGKSKPSMARSLIEANQDEDGTVHDESTIAGALGIAYVGGADTSISVILSFVLAMVLNPSIQSKAQDELDSVLGTDRLPTMEDVGDFEIEDTDADKEGKKPRTKLRYIRAIVLECLRWNPVAPLGAPHALTQDDVYDSHFIPAKTMIIANVWAMLHDPIAYPEPDSFTPERWLSTSDGSGSAKSVPIHPMKIALGFGRRVCPGRYFAYNSIFLTIASILSMFDILPALDEDGVPIIPKIEYTPSLISHPLPFPCQAVPRTRKTEELIRAACVDAEEALG